MPTHISLIESKSDEVEGVGLCVHHCHKDGWALVVVTEGVVLDVLCAGYHWSRLHSLAAPRVLSYQHTAHKHVLVASTVWYSVLLL